MAEARTEVAWLQVRTLMAHLSNIWCRRKGDAVFTADDFKPGVGGGRKRGGIPLTTGNLDLLKAWVPGATRTATD